MPVLTICNARIIAKYHNSTFNPTRLTVNSLYFQSICFLVDVKIKTFVHWNSRESLCLNCARQGEKFPNDSKQNQKLS